MMLDNAREHGVDVHEGVRVLDVLFEGERAVGVRIKSEDGSGAARCAPRSSSMPAARVSMILNRLQAARVGPGAEEGRPLDLLGRGLPRHGPRRRGDARHPDPEQERLVLVHPAARQHRSASASSRAFDYLFKGRGDVTRQIYLEEVDRCPAVKDRVLEWRKRVDRLLRHEGVFVSRHSRPPATAGCWSATPSAFSIRSIRRACCWRCKSGQLAADAIAEGLAKGDTSAAQLGKWEPDFNAGHGPHAAAGVRVLRRLQLRPLRQAASRT